MEVDDMAPWMTIFRLDDHFPNRKPMVNSTSLIVSIYNIIYKIVNHSKMLFITPARQPGAPGPRSAPVPPSCWGDMLGKKLLNLLCLESIRILPWKKQPRTRLCI